MSAEEAKPLDEPTARSQSTVDSESDEPLLTKDLVFGILQNKRRRDVLRYLMSVDRMVTQAELAEQIAAQENGITVAELDSAQRKRVYVALYQTHLPKLDEAGLIEYNSNRGHAKLTDIAPALKPYLEEEPATENETTGEWNRHYLALSVAGFGAIFLMHLAGLQSLAVQTLLSVSVIGVLLVLSVLHTYSKYCS